MAASSSAAPSDSYDIQWVEKSRPTRVADVVGNADSVARLQVIARDGNMPNLILSGPPGTVKTTSILTLVHELLGPSYREAVLEVNAFDDRGLDVVRNKIKMFAQKKVTLQPGRHKVVILDEADRFLDIAVPLRRRVAAQMKFHLRYMQWHLCQNFSQLFPSFVSFHWSLNNNCFSCRQI